MKTILRFLKKYKLECFMAPFFKLLEACFDLLVPIVVKYIMDVGIKNGDTAYVIRGCVLLAILGVIGLCCALVAQYFSARAAVGVATAMRGTVFAHLQNLSYAESDKLGRASMITRMTSDINQVQTGVNMTLRLFLRSPIIVFGAMIMSALISPRYIALFAIVIIVLAVITFGIILAGIPLYKRVQTKLDKVTGKTRETLRGVRVVRAFNREQDEINEFRAANDAHTHEQNFTGRITALLNPLTAATVNIGIIAILHISSVQIDAGDITQGDLFALYNYMSQILVELVKLASTVLIIVKAVACSHRIEAAMNIPVGMQIKEDDTRAGTDGEYAVEYDNVTMTYEGAGAPSLENVNLKVKKGSVVGVIGGTGSGKTTLVNLIPRFYDATCGNVKVFGKNVAAYDPAELREKIAVVPQKAVLFKGTVRSNLLWGKPDAADAELWAALEDAQMRDSVEQKDGGLDAPVEQFGRNFSGGQRQRLTVARALVRRAPILILDDSASALDFATEARLRQALRELDYHPTVFIVSQRTSSISHADVIVVLDEGRVVGLGTHESLLESCSLYREIYDSQFGGGER